MRTTNSLRATVKSAARYLEANTPTGLTGLPTHPTPRPALMSAYVKTLSELKSLPESSVYRQSTEALTKHRLAIVQSTKPPGYDEWVERTKKQIDSNPAYKKFMLKNGLLMHKEASGPEIMSWDGVVSKAHRRSEGSNTQAEAEAKGAEVVEDVKEVERRLKDGPDVKISDLETEPALTADQIDEIEQKIGAGLIEEIIQVAEGELNVVEEMIRSKSYEDLEEKAPPGQWEYFDRGDRV